MQIAFREINIKGIYKWLFRSPAVYYDNLSILKFCRKKRLSEVG